MTPKKKPDAAITDVHIAGVDKNVTENAAEVIEQRSHRTQIILAMIGLLGAITLAVQTSFTVYMQAKTREAVESGVTVAKESADSAKAHADIVAVKLEATSDEQIDKLDEIKKTADETKETSERTNVIVNSGALINARMYVAALKRLVAANNDPDDIEELRKAEQAVKEHETGQKVLDTRDKNKDG